jgi:hypothetical protein
MSKKVTTETEASKLTGSNLKQELWGLVQGVKSKRVSPEMANSISTLSREIIRVVRTEMALANMGKTSETQNLLK